jgi:hypothetical protein
VLPVTIELLTILALVSSLGIWSARSAAKFRQKQESTRGRQTVNSSEPAEREEANLNESNAKAMEQASGENFLTTSAKKQYPRANVG